MKIALTMISLLIMTSLVSANDLVDHTTATVVYSDAKVYCIKFMPMDRGADRWVNASGGVAVSCVSQVSMQKDTLELEVLRLQNEKLELELKKKKK